MKPDFGSMMKQARKLQADIERVQEELKDETVEASLGGGAVKVAVSGDLRVRAVEIAPSAVDPEDTEMLQDLVAAAVNEALRMAQELSAKRMAEVAGPLGGGLPGMF